MTISESHALTIAPAYAVGAAHVRRRFESLDGYRALAALAVVVYHTAGFVGFLRPEEPGAHIIDNFGNFGVAVFFGLSGFVIFRSFAICSFDDNQLPATAPYFIRRALRIFPAYWLALIAWAVVTTPSKRVPGTTLGKFFLTDPYDPRLKTWQYGLGVAWTLTIEIAFYLFVPVYAWSITRCARRHSDRTRRLRVHLIGLGLMYVCAFLFRSCLHWWHGAPINAINYLPAYFDWFALGMLLSVLSVWQQSGHSLPAMVQGLADRTWACWVCGATAFTAIVVLKGDELQFARNENAGQISWRLFFQGLAAFFVILPATLGNPSQPIMRVLRSRPLVFLGTISYGIYLWHVIVITWAFDMIDQATARERFAVLTALTLVLTIPLATLSYYGLERRFAGLFTARPKPPNSTNSTFTEVEPIARVEGNQ